MVDVVTLGESLLAFRVAGPLAVGAEARFSFAGAESNVAVGLARLGHAVACAGAVGGDAMATTMVRALRGEGIDCSALRVDAARPSALIVFDSPLAERRRVTYLRDGSAGSALTPADADAVWALNPGVVHVTGVTCALGDGARETVEVVVGEARRRGWRGAMRWRRSRWATTATGRACRCGRNCRWWVRAATSSAESAPPGTVRGAPTIRPAPTPGGRAARCGTRRR